MYSQDDSVSVNNIQEEGLKVLKTKSTIFDDEEKSKLLQKLLQSKNPDDLQTANRLIKTMVKEVIFIPLIRSIPFIEYINSPYFIG